MSVSNFTILTLAVLISLSTAPPGFAQPTKIRVASTAATSTEKVAFALAKENPKAKNVTPQQVIDLSFLP